MAILAKGEFDIEAHRRAKAQKSNKTDLVAGLRQISPEIEKLKVGQTAVIEGVDEGKIRSTVMSITAKLSHLTARGGDWAGQVYGVASDADTGTVYVQRQTGTKPEDAPVRKTGGGRPKGSKNGENNTEVTDEAETEEETVETEAENTEADSSVKVVEHA